MRISSGVSWIRYDVHKIGSFAFAENEKKKEKKRMKKKVLAVILGAAMIMSLAACGSGNTGSDSGDGTYTIGISQFAEHGSLDNCREGFI